MKLATILTVLAIIGFHQSQAQNLTECFKCTGSTDCEGDKDFCNGHDRCLKLDYTNWKGKKVHDARCSKFSECETEIGKIILCDEKEDCKVSMCCKTNNCNSHAVWARFDVRLMALVSMAIFILLKR